MLFAGAAGAGLVAADFRARAKELLDGRVVMVSVVAVGPVHVAGRTVVMLLVLMIVIAVRAMHMCRSQLGRICHARL